MRSNAALLFLDILHGGATRHDFKHGSATPALSTTDVNIYEIDIHLLTNAYGVNCIMNDIAFWTRHIHVHQIRSAAMEYQLQDALDRLHYAGSQCWVFHGHPVPYQARLIRHYFPLPLVRSTRCIFILFRMRRIRIASLPIKWLGEHWPTSDDGADWIVVTTQPAWTRRLGLRSRIEEPKDQFLLALLNTNTAA